MVDAGASIEALTQCGERDRDEYMIALLPGASPSVLYTRESYFMAEN